jgi:hypothetical protein
MVRSSVGADAGVAFFFAGPDFAAAFAPCLAGVFFALACFVRPVCFAAALLLDVFLGAAILSPELKNLS